MKSMLSADYPMIAPLPFSEQTPESWHAFVKSLKIEPERKAEAPLKAKMTKKRKVSLTLPRGRKPAWVTMSELEALSQATGIGMNLIYIAAKGKAMIIKKKEGAR